MILPWQPSLWLGTAVVLALATCVVVGAAAVGVRLTRAVVWQRAFWRVAILGILTLLAAEATGISTGIVQWWRVSGLIPHPTLSLVTESADSSTSPIRRSAPGVVPSERLATDATETGFLASRGDRAGLAASTRLASASEAIPPASASGEHSSGGVADNLLRWTARGGPETTDPRSATAASQTVSGNGYWGAYLTFVWVLDAAVLFGRMAWARWLLHAWCCVAQYQASRWRARTTTSLQQPFAVAPGELLALQ